MPSLSPGELLSHLVELFDYRVKEVSYVDEGANLLPFLLTKNLHKRDDVKKEAFEALLRTEVKNAKQVVEVLKRAEVPEDEQEAVQNVFKVLTGLTKVKSLSRKTLGDALAAAELAEITGEADEKQLQIKKAFDFIADKVAVKINKMIDDEMKKEDDPDMGDANVKSPPEGKAEKNFGEEEEGDEEKPAEKSSDLLEEEDKELKEGGSDPSEEEAEEAEDINKRMGGNDMDLSKLPLTKEGTLDIVALKKSKKLDEGTISVVKSLFDQNQSLTKNLDAVNEKLNNEVELRVDKHYELEADVFKSLKVEGLKDILKSFGQACPDDYPKLKSLLAVASDAMKRPEEQAFSPMGGSRGGVTPSEPQQFYNVCKRKAVEIFKDDPAAVAIQKYWKTEEGRKDYGTYDQMVTNGR